MDFFDILLAKKLEGGGGGDVTIEQLDVTENGTYSEPGKAYRPVVVNLPLDEKVITENGTYNASADNLQGYNKVVVNVSGYKLKAMTLGAISTFTDGVDLPLNKLVVGIEDDTNVGVSECNLTRCGKNLFDGIFAEITSTVKYRQIKVVNGTYTMSSTCPLESGMANVFFIAGYATSGASSINNGVYDLVSRTVTTSDGYVTIGYRKNTSQYNPENFDNQIEVGSTATTYEAYNGNTYNIQFPSGVTISNGSIDILNGVLTDDDLSETYNITPIAIRSLEGVNNVFTDTGDILEGEYFAAL